MSMMEHHYTSGAQCDATGCDAQFRWPMTASWFEVRVAMQVAGQEGWRAFASRSLRHYCPDHGPRPGHKMREVTL